MNGARAEILAKVRRAQRSELEQHEILENLTELGVAPPAPHDGANKLESFLKRLQANHVTVEFAPSRAL